MSRGTHGRHQSIDLKVGEIHVHSFHGFEQFVGGDVAVRIVIHGIKKSVRSVDVLAVQRSTILHRLQQLTQRKMKLSGVRGVQGSGGRGGRDGRGG